MNLRRNSGKMSHAPHYHLRVSSSIDEQHAKKQTSTGPPSPRRQNTRQTTQQREPSPPPEQQQVQQQQQQQYVIKPLAVRPPPSDNPYNLRSRSKLKTTSTSNDKEVLPSFNEKLSLDSASTLSPPATVKEPPPKPPLTRAAAASAGVKVDFPPFFNIPEVPSSSSKSPVQQKNSTTPTTTTTTTTPPQTRSRKRKCEDEHRPHLDLLKMKQLQTQSTYSFDTAASPKKVTRRTDILNNNNNNNTANNEDENDSGCDYDSPAHSPIDFTDLPPPHFEESNMSYDSGVSAGSGGEKTTTTTTGAAGGKSASQSSQQYHDYPFTLPYTQSSAITTRSGNRFIELDLASIEGDLN